VIVRADDPASLPTKPDGSVDEDKIDPSDQIGEIEDIEQGAKVSKTFDLDPGSYVLFCNVVQDDVNPPISHFAKGMSTSFNVSE
jgi:hypothetical protein